MKLKPQITEIEAKIDEILYKSDIFFAKERDALNPNLIFYGSNINGKFRFGFIGWDYTHDRIGYIGEYTEATSLEEKNCKAEGIEERPDPHLFELHSQLDFIKWMKNESIKVLMNGPKKTLVD